MKHCRWTMGLVCALALLWGAELKAVEIEEGDQPTLEQLKTVLLTGSVRGREAAAERLASLRTPEAMAVMFDGLADSIAAYLTADALEKSIKTKREGMAALLLPGLSHKDYRARMLTAYMLGQCKDASASEPLAKALGDDNYNVRMYAAEALRAAGDKTAVPTLICALNDKYPLVRLHAAAALGVLKDTSAIVPLIAALGDSDAAVNAATALGAIGGAEAETALLKATKDARAKVAWAAIAALGACAKAPATSTELKTLAESANNERTKYECEAALKAIAGRNK